MKRLFVLVVFLAVGLDASPDIDCFQHVAQRGEDGLIEGLADPISIEQSTILLLTEISQCTGLSGLDLYIEILNEYARLESEKSSTRFQFYMTLAMVEHFFVNMPYPLSAVIERLAPLWYETAKKKSREIYLDYLFRLSAIPDNEGDFTADPWAYNFSPHKSLLDSETDKTSELALALLDFMFTCAPGKALLTLNASASAEELESLKSTVAPLLRLHSRKDPNSWAKKDLQPYKDAMHSVITSNYAYRDLFLAEIVYIVHDLKTPEVAAFLEQSTNPLVRRRIDNPYVYVPLESSNMNE